MIGRREERTVKRKNEVLLVDSFRKTAIVGKKLVPTFRVEQLSALIKKGALDLPGHLFFDLD